MHRFLTSVLITALTIFGIGMSPAVASVPVSCGESGTFTITLNVISDGSSCEGEAIIPSTVTEIASGAFFEAIDLTKVTFAGESQLLTIGDSAFSRASALNSITIPASVRTLGNDAFAETTALTSITIPASVSSIGFGALFLSGITTFNVDAFNTWKSAFRECVKLSSKTIDRQDDTDTNYRLNVWCTRGIDRQFGREAIEGAVQGKQYGLENKDNNEALKMINDFDWLRERFGR